MRDFLSNATSRNLPWLIFDSLQVGNHVEFSTLQHNSIISPTALSLYLSPLTLLSIYLFPLPLLYFLTLYLPLSPSPSPSPPPLTLPSFSLSLARAITMTF